MNADCLQLRHDLLQITLPDQAWQKGYTPQMQHAITCGARALWILHRSRRPEVRASQDSPAHGLRLDPDQPLSQGRSERPSDWA